MRTVAAMPPYMGANACEDEPLRTVAALSTTGYDPALGEVGGYPWLLASYAYPDASADRLPARVQGARAVWIDSGAFTVWNSGGTVDLDAYIGHLLKLRKRLPMPLVPINLDVIPGTPTRRATPAEAQTAIAESERNADRIRAAGLHVMEVWHRGEPIEHLAHLLDRRQPGEVVGIGGLVGLKQTSRTMAVCDPVFRLVRQRYGWKATPPLHGLGVGNRDVIFRYPWWSCDSTSWIAPGVWGRKITRDGKTTLDPRTRNRVMRMHECANVLRAWQRWDRDLTRLWHQRGVRFTDPPEDA